MNNYIADNILQDDFRPPSPFDVYHITWCPVYDNTTNSFDYSKVRVFFDNKNNETDKFSRIIEIASRERHFE